MLKLINGIPRKPKLTDKRHDKDWLMEIYGRVATSNLDKFAHTLDRHLLEGQVLCMVRLFNLMSDDTIDDLLTKYEASQRTLKIMGLLTPQEFERAFIINKTYDGKRFECIDFFSTKQKFEGLTQHEPLCTEVEMLDFLFGYDNHDICCFVAGLCTVISKLRRLHGEDDLLTGFFKSQGKEPPITYRLHTDNNGKQYMTDEDGHSFKVKKPRPRHLRIVK
jgi:hypothetical protein